MAISRAIGKTLYPKDISWQFQSRNSFPEQKFLADLETRINFQKSIREIYKCNQ